MTAQWSAGQSTWPAHLRDDAPSQQCGRCGRYTRSPSEFGAECRMRQPDGYPCGGRFEPPGILLDLYAARVGAPIPADTATPLPEEYEWIGKGRARLAEREPRWTGDPFIGSVVGNPRLLVRWELRTPVQQASAVSDAAIPMTTIIGHGTNNDGAVVRMIAHRAGRMEDEQHGGVVTTTIDLHSTAPDGHHVTWYYAEPLPDVVAKWYFAEVNGSWEVA